MKDGVAAKDYVELETLNHQLREIERTVQLTDQEIEHGTLALRMLEEFAKAAEDQEILIPLGSGAFCSVQAGNVKDIKMVVGGGVMIDRSPDEAKQGLQQQLNELQAHRERSLQRHDEVIDQIIQVQDRIESSLQG